MYDHHCTIITNVSHHTVAKPQPWRTNAPVLRSPQFADCAVKKEHVEWLVQVLLGALQFNRAVSRTFALVTKSAGKQHLQEINGMAMFL
jgi:hypothetical protein